MDASQPRNPWIDRGRERWHLQSSLCAWGLDVCCCVQFHLRWNWKCCVSHWFYKGFQVHLRWTWKWPTGDANAGIFSHRCSHGDWLSVAVFSSTLGGTENVTFSYWFYKGFQVHLRCTWKWWFSIGFTRYFSEFQVPLSGFWPRIANTAWHAIPQRFTKDVPRVYWGNHALVGID